MPTALELRKKVKKTSKVMDNPLAISQEERLGKLKRERQ